MSDKKKTGFDVKTLGHLAPAALVAALVAATLPVTVPLLRDVPEKLSPAEEEPIPSETGSETEEGAKGDYTDGIYTGKGNGFGGQIEVKVIVEDKQIALVDILDSRKETAGYLSKARAVIDDVLQKQTWEVDTVSGATISSKGILEAIENAITGKEPIDFVESVTGKPIQPEQPVLQKPDNSGSGGNGNSSKPIVIVKPETPSKPDNSKPVVKPPVSKPDNHTPGTDTPGTDTPGTDTPGTDTPGTDTPGTDTPGTDTPGTDTPGTDIPGTDTPGTDTPGTDIPGTETPDPENPGTETPEDPTLNPDNHRMTISVTAPEKGEFESYEIMVDVVITDGKIESISIPAENLYGGSEKEDETNKSFVEKALEGLLDLILEKQDTKDVDVVSGATYSSQAILDAVHQALIEAGVIEPDPIEETENTEAEEKPVEEKPVEEKPTDSASDKKNADKQTDKKTGDKAAAGSRDTVEKTTTGKTAAEKAAAEKAATEKAAKEAAEKEAAEKAAAEKEAAEKAAAEKAAKEAAEKEAAEKEAAEKEAAEKAAAEKAAKEAAEKEAAEKAAAEKEAAEKEAEEEEDTVKYKDGTYTISGWVRPDKQKKFSAYKLSLTVTVKDGKVTDMSLSKKNLYGGKKKVNSKNEKYTKDAWNDIRGYVLENNTADVDVTTGATSSSRTLINAMRSLQKVTDDKASQDDKDSKKLITVTLKDEKGNEKTYTYKIESDK